MRFENGMLKWLVDVSFHFLCVESRVRSGIEVAFFATEKSFVRKTLKSVVVFLHHAL